MNGTFLVYLNGTTDYCETYIYMYDYGGSASGTIYMYQMFINWVGV